MVVWSPGLIPVDCTLNNNDNNSDNNNNDKASIEQMLYAIYFQAFDIYCLLISLPQTYKVRTINTPILQLEILRHAKRLAREWWVGFQIQTSWL